MSGITFHQNQNFILFNLRRPNLRLYESFKTVEEKEYWVL